MTAKMGEVHSEAFAVQLTIALLMRRNLDSNLDDEVARNEERKRGEMCN
jgi:hypothetical protein